MKRVVFILLVVGLLLCSEAVTLLATRAATDAAGSVKAQSLDFYYKLDEKARYQDIKSRWQNERRGELSTNKADELAQEAYNQAAMESPFTQWRYHGGPAPNVFSGKIHLYNTGKTALLNYPLTVTVRAKVGELRVNPVIQLTDFQHLEQSGQWQTLSRKTVSIPAIAPGEDMLVETMQFRLLDFLARHPHEWPSEIELLVSAPGLKSVRKSLSLIPDHFAVPVQY